MKIKYFVIGLIATSLVVYKVATFKLGPCSPELEIIVNGKES